MPLISMMLAEPEFQGNGSTSGEEEDSYDSYGTYTEEELQSMTVKELRAVLKDLGIKQPRLKAEMIEAILEAEDEDEPPPRPPFRRDAQ